MQTQHKRDETKHSQSADCSARRDRSRGDRMSSIQKIAQQAAYKEVARPGTDEEREG